MDERRSRIRKPQGYATTGSDQQSDRETVTSGTEGRRTRPARSASDSASRRASGRSTGSSQAGSKSKNNVMQLRRRGGEQEENDEIVRRNTRTGTVEEKSGYDFTMIFIIICLCGFGLMMLFSASAYKDMVAGKSAFNTVLKQGLYVVVGLGIMLGVSLVPYHFWDRAVIFFYLIGYGACIATSFIGVTRNNSSRWLKIGPISVQPAEIMKVTLIMLMALILVNMGGKLKKLYNWILPIALVALSVAPIIRDNLSSGIIIGMIGMIVIFAATKRLWPFLALAATGAVGVVIAYRTNLLSRFLQPYQMSRIYAWLNPFAYKDNNMGNQTVQSLYAIASGGFKGKGLGMSIQKLSSLPEANNDFIFGVICEELGVFGAIFVLALFGVLIWRMILIAQNAPDRYGLLLCAGVIGHIGMQVTLNIGVATGLVPNTGIGLPFISSGGSAIMILMVEMGLVLSISRETRIEVNN